MPVKDLELHPLVNLVLQDHYLQRKQLLGYQLHLHRRIHRDYQHRNRDYMELLEMTLRHLPKLGIPNYQTM
jgi:hypothetical protein